LYAVSVTSSAQKDIRALDRPVIPRILQAMNALGKDARPAGCKKLVGGGELWRIRVGDYRIIYRIDDSTKSVEVVIVRHRREAYD
jgi:mRNA interferase RelE/StbE